MMGNFKANRNYVNRQGAIMRVILASGSPRRELLTKIYKDFEVITSDADETVADNNPAEIVKELSKRKAEAVFNELENASEDIIVIGADTIVYYDGEVLGKPQDEEEAKAMLSMLSERTHQVYTGVTFIAVKNGKKTINSFADKTDVEFYFIDKFDIADYVATGSPLDKAGAYGIQDEFAKHVKRIDGDYNNVVGLPVARLYQELKCDKLV